MRIGLIGWLCLWSAVSFTVLCDAGSMGRCGGTGGTTTKTLTCGTDEFVIEMHGIGGLFLDGIEIDCGKIDSTGHISGVVRRLTAGPKANVSMTNGGVCRNEYGVIEVDFHCGTFVDQLQGALCGIYSPGTGIFQNIPFNTFTIAAGGGGGTAVRKFCPNGEGLYQVIVKYGSTIDSVEGVCRKPPVHAQ